MGKRDQYTETCHKERYVTTWKKCKDKEKRDYYIENIEPYSQERWSHKKLSTYDRFHNMKSVSQ